MIKMSKMNRKGELTTGQIISIILIIIGFLALLWFVVYQLGFSGRIDKDTCHTSVVLRGTLPSLGGAEQYAPLKCKAEKICITAGFIGGNCESDYGNEKGITKVKVNDIEQIQQFIAQDIVECWNIMGQGKVNLFSQWIAGTYGIGSVYPTCVVCSRIAFDREKLSNIGINLGDMDLNKYMSTHLIPGKTITYTDFFAGENSKVKISDTITLPNGTTINGKTSLIASDENVPVQELTQEEIDAQIAEERKNADLQSRAFAILFMQISAPTQFGSAANIGKTLFVGGVSSFVLAPGVTTSAVKSGAKLCTSGGWVGPAVCGGLLALVGIAQQTNVAINRQVTAGYCGDVSVGTDARNGCSAVRTVHYDVSEISNYCSIIEGIP